MELLKACANVTTDISPSVPKKLKVDNIPEELWICTGKRYPKICCSRFCEAEVLEIKNTIYNNMDQEMQKQMSFPSNKHIETMEKSITANQMVLLFKYEEFSASDTVILKFFVIMQNLKVGQDLVLIGYCLLTCVNVGLLHLIGHTFNDLEIKARDDVGCQIILHHYNYNVKVLHLLHEIKIASDTAARQEASVLSIYPITFLYDSNLFTTIVDVNHWNIKRHTEYMIKQLIHKKQSNPQEVGI
ncbi:hypothetical protein KM043_016019 [Ampulex compressa]|nr:hypothetical protein KM043_016019 [Ampulex compressa]